MISSDLHALGFDYPEWDDLVRAIISSPMKSIMDIEPFGAVGLYQDESGAAISLFSIRTNHHTLHPHYKAHVVIMSKHISFIRHLLYLTNMKTMIQSPRIVY